MIDMLIKEILSEFMDDYHKVSYGTIGLKIEKHGGEIATYEIIKGKKNKNKNKNLDN